MTISVRNLVKSYNDTTVIKGISFEVAAGEFVTLLGPSGCGKTTTLRCIAGLETISEGQIRINDLTVSDAARNIFVAPNERHLGMVFQSYAVWPHMTVAQNVAFPLTVRGRKDTAEDVKWALEIVGMGPLAERRPSELSGGQQQRVALARAIAGHPDLLLFDEPLSNLDARLRDRTRLEISRIQRELKVPAIYVTHDQTEALSMSDRIIVMESGHVMQEGTPDAIYHAPVNRFVADFIGSANFLNVRRQGDHWLVADGTVLHVHAQPEGDRDRPLSALVRPEAIRVERTEPNVGASTDGPGVNRLDGVVTRSVFLGAYIEHLVDIAGRQVRAHTREPIPAGTPINLVFNAADCRLVDNHD